MHVEENSKSKNITELTFQSNPSALQRIPCIERVLPMKKRIIWKKPENSLDNIRDPWNKFAKTKILNHESSTH